MHYLHLYPLFLLCLLPLALDVATGAAVPSSFPVKSPDPSVGARLISLDNDAPAVWMSSDEVQALARQRRSFFDVTDFQEANPVSPQPTRPVIPKLATKQTLVNPLLAKLSIDRMKADLEAFTSFPNRYYQSAEGVKSATWLLDQISQIFNTTQGVNATLKVFQHAFPQFSLVVRLEGSNPQHADEIVVLGAHQDTINLQDTLGRAPGADDDGTGSVTLLEILRVLTSSKFTPERSLEFHWYAAEEVGLLGSQQIAYSYRNASKKIAGQLQIDMTGYVAPGQPEAFGVVTDYVDAELSAFLRKVVGAYSSVPYKDTLCGYGCSDFASWTKSGYPSAFLFESVPDVSNPFIHSAEDTIALIDWKHAGEYAKVALGFAVELSFGPNMASHHGK
ncbi:uncharacterized protein VTP21DRAFT_4046 [Calcarisporiella thermophila]|uniref:uncharacterized protein n=1 Tax=Calcarisporiella thermophila TaxID=911321 RepID=UPI003741E934